MTRFDDEEEGPSVDEMSLEGLTECVCVSVRAEGEGRRLELPRGFIELLRAEEETASTADVVGDLLLLSAAQRTYESVHYSEAGAGEPMEAINDRMQELFEAEFGTTLKDVAGYPDPSEDAH